MHARALKSTKNLSLRKWTEYTGKVFFLQTAAAFAEQTQSKQEEKKEKKTLKQTVISRKANTEQDCCPQTFVVRTFETKRVSKQVNHQDTVFTFSCSLCAEEFDLFLLYIPQCHKHNAVSPSFKGPSVTGSGGKDQIFISKTQSGNLNEIQWK